MEAALLNLLEQGERILVVQNGLWGQRAASLSKRLKFDVSVIEVPNGKACNLSDFEEVRFSGLSIDEFFALGAQQAQTSGCFYLSGRVFDWRITSFGRVRTSVSRCRRSFNCRHRRKSVCRSIPCRQTSS